MSWARVLQFDPGPDRPLRQRIQTLFEQQRETWPALRESEAALEHLQKKTLLSDGESVIVQMNPARRRSTMAQIDAKAVAGRACFLCPENMPPEERGVAFEDLVLLPNPFPVLPMHCTIASREHRPQQIAGRIGTFLRLAQAIGPDFAALYNGPQCGASAPDHFHFQSAAANQIPILTQLPPRSGRPHGTYSSFGRSLYTIAGTNVANVGAELEQRINALQSNQSAADEPMFNLLAHFSDAHFIVVLFPRATHRPGCYFATGANRIAVSPAVLEMCGVLVVTEPEDFDRLDAATARSIYEEVSTNPSRNN
jgi:Domain of unknown function (DUF4922)